MKIFTQISESNYDVNFIKNYLYDEDREQFFKFVKNMDEIEDSDAIAHYKGIHGLIDIAYHEMHANYGDTVFLVITYDEMSDLFVKGYVNVFDAFKEALELWIEFSEGVDYYGVKIFKWKIEKNPKKENQGSMEVFNKDDYLLHGEKNINSNKNEIVIIPEYSNNPKIKNLMMSVKGISKFKL